MRLLAGELQAWFILFYCSLDFFSLVQVCSDYLFLLESGLVVCVFLETCPFPLGDLLCWLFIAFPYNPFYFCKVGSNAPIPKFNHFNVLSLPSGSV